MIHRESTCAALEASRPTAEPGHCLCPKSRVPTAKHTTRQDLCSVLDLPPKFTPSSNFPRGPSPTCPGNFDGSGSGNGSGMIARISKYHVLCPSHILLLLLSQHTIYSETYPPFWTSRLLLSPAMRTALPLEHSSRITPDPVQSL
jgi:hypothetical protein